MHGHCTRARYVWFRLVTAWVGPTPYGGLKNKLPRGQNIRWERLDGNAIIPEQTRTGRPYCGAMPRSFKGSAVTNQNGDLHNAPPVASDTLKAQIEIFQFQSGEPLEISSATERALDAADLRGFKDALGAGFSDGSLVRVLFDNKMTGFSLFYNWFKANFVHVRHSHSTHCLYYILSGEVHLGARVLRAGDGFFVPAETLYTYSAGPHGVEVLEFRSDLFGLDIKFKMNAVAWKKLASVAAENAESWRRDTVPPVLQMREHAEQGGEAGAQA